MMHNERYNHPIEKIHPPCPHLNKITMTNKNTIHFVDILIKEIIMKHISERIRETHRRNKLYLRAMLSDALCTLLDYW